MAGKLASQASRLLNHLLALSFDVAGLKYRTCNEIHRKQQRFRGKSEASFAHGVKAKPPPSSSARELTQHRTSHGEDRVSVIVIAPHSEWTRTLLSVCQRPIFVVAVPNGTFDARCTKLDTLLVIHEIERCLDIQVNRHAFTRQKMIYARRH